MTGVGLLDGIRREHADGVHTGRINVTQENRPLLNTEILYFLIIHEPGEKV